MIFGMVSVTHGGFLQQENVHESQRWIFQHCPFFIMHCIHEKRWEVAEWLHSWQLLKKGSAP
jgi:hypothetical protein